MKCYEAASFWRRPQAADKGPIAASLQKDQTLAYRKYASVLLFFYSLHSNLFQQPARLDFVINLGPPLLGGGLFCIRAGLVATEYGDYYFKWMMRWTAKRGMLAANTHNFNTGVESMKLVSIIMALLAVFAAVSPGVAEEGVYSCGFAEGYPPYQYQDGEGNPVGLDVEVLSLVFEKMKAVYSVRQAEWDTIVSNLCYGDLDCVGGMEINKVRRKCFDFTEPYYSRGITIFLLENDMRIRTVKDLKSKVIAGDRHSSVEEYLKAQGFKKQVRLLSTYSKDISMRMLKDREVDGVIAPRAVGFHLAYKYKMNVRTLDVPCPASPVGIAVKRGNRELLLRLDAALRELEREGRLRTVIDKWRQ